MTALASSLVATNIAKSYPTANGDLSILRQISLTLSAGESAAITGPSGSGKSTLLNILGTLEPPSAGQLLIHGADPFSMPPRELARFRNRRIGFIFQDHHLLPQCSAIENVLLPTLAGEKNSSKNNLLRAGELLDRVGLSKRGEHRPAELSGGERQRVAIARALINQPALVLADELTGNLDRATADSVMALILEIHKEMGAVLIVVTHSDQIAKRMSVHWSLNEGKLEPLTQP